MEKQLHDAKLQLRFTSDQKKMLEAQAKKANLPLGTYVRNLVLNTQKKA